MDKESGKMLTTKMMVIAMIGMMMAVGAIPLLDAEETDADSTQIMLLGMGQNRYGAIGTGDTQNVLTPTRIGDFTNIGEVSASFNNAVFIDSGRLYGMGWNRYGELGQGNTNQVTTPTRIGDFTNVTSVQESDSCTVFIDSGRLYGMGRNHYGELGQGNTDQATTPIRIGDFTNVTAVRINNTDTIFIDSGRLYGMGKNSYGVLGNGRIDSYELSPIQIGDFTNVTQILLSQTNALIIDSGRLYGLGFNSNNQISPENIQIVTTPTRIGDFTNVTHISSDVSNTMFIDSGHLYGMGQNQYGELGQGNTNQVTTPTRIGDFTNVTSVYCNQNALFIDSGRLFGMGRNMYGQLGLGNTDPVLTPTRIGDFTNVTSVQDPKTKYGFAPNTYFIDSGRLYGMGQNQYGELGLGNTNQVITPTRIGDFTNVSEVYTANNNTYVKLNGIYTATIESNNTAYGTVSPSTVTEIEYGTAIQVSGNTLTIGTNTVTATPATETAYYTYAFDGWYVGSTPLVTGTVVSNITITAQFTATPKPFTVPISANPPDAGSVSVDSITVPYGSVMTVNGQALTVGGTTVTATVKDSDTQYTYAWVGWLYNGQPVVSGTTAISGTAPITASMSKEVTTYTVTWIYGPASERITETETYAYGETPSHADPPALSEIEPFEEWSPAISPVTGSITYTAVYSNPTDKAPSMIILVLPYIVAIGMIIATAGMINSRNEGKWEKGDYLQLIIGLTISIVALATILIPICNVLA